MSCAGKITGLGPPSSGIEPGGRSLSGTGLPSERGASPRPLTAATGACAGATHGAGEVQGVAPPSVTTGSGAALGASAADALATGAAGCACAGGPHSAPSSAHTQPSKTSQPLLRSEPVRAFT